MLQKKHTTGFTVIEMMIVLAIVLLIITIGIVEYFSFARQAVRNDATVAAKAFATALNMYKFNDPDGQYPPAISYLSSYVNTTSLVKKYDFISIYRLPAGTVCATGRVKNITPVYWVNYCAALGSTARTRGENQPSCCWTKDGVDCSADANWYACTSKF